MATPPVTTVAVSSGPWRNICVLNRDEPRGATCTRRGRCIAARGLLAFGLAAAGWLGVAGLAGSAGGTWPTPPAIGLALFLTGMMGGGPVGVLLSGNGVAGDGVAEDGVDGGGAAGAGRLRNSCRSSTARR